MIRILTDSASDITPAEAALLGVTIVPLNVTLEDGTVLRDGLDMTGDEYYSLLASCNKLPTTSQPSPELFAAEYAAANPASASRPAWSALENRMLRCSVGDEMRDWQDALKDFFANWNGEL